MPRLVRVTETKPSWMAFAGTWGEDGYLHFPGNEPILVGAGPLGPAFHEQWRRPVTEVLSVAARLTQALPSGDAKGPCERERIPSCTTPECQVEAQRPRKRPLISRERNPR